MKNPEATTAAFLYSPEAPTEEQRKRFEDFLARTYPDRTNHPDLEKDAQPEGRFPPGSGNRCL